MIPVSFERYGNSAENCCFIQTTQARVVKSVQMFIFHEKNYLDFFHASFTISLISFKKPQQFNYVSKILFTIQKSYFTSQRSRFSQGQKSITVCFIQKEGKNIAMQRHPVFAKAAACANLAAVPLQKAVDPTLHKVPLANFSSLQTPMRRRIQCALQNSVPLSKMIF